MFQTETSPFFIPQTSIPSSQQAYHIETATSLKNL